MSAQTSHSTPASAERDAGATRVAGNKDAGLKGRISVLGGVRAGDQVIVTRLRFGPDRKTRTVRELQTVTRVFKRVLQTSAADGIDIKTGRGRDGATVAPATPDDVAVVEREGHEMYLADLEYTERARAEQEDYARCAALRTEIHRALSVRVPESVLRRVLSVLQDGEQRDGS